MILQFENEKCFSSTYNNSYSFSILIHVMYVVAADNDCVPGKERQGIAVFVELRRPTTGGIFQLREVGKLGDL